MVQQHTKWVVTVALLLSVSPLLAQAPSPQPAASGSNFEVATIKPVEPDAKKSRYLVMQGTNRFVGKYYTLKLLIAAAYDLSPKVISGGPEWMDSDH